MGVSAFCFFPVFVAAFTSTDEFHSVTNTRCPSALSHFASRPSCVVFPDPSIPSTTNSFPGYSCGFVRLFNMALSTHLESKGLANQALERRDVPRRSPHFQLRVAARPDLQQAVFATIVQLDGGDGLLMTAIEAFSQPQDRGERADRAPAPAAEVAEAVVPFF